MGTHLLGVPAVVLFMALGWMVERSGRISALDAWIVFLAGFFLGGTGVGTVLTQIFQTIANAIGGIK